MRVVFLFFSALEREIFFVMSDSFFCFVFLIVKITSIGIAGDKEKGRPVLEEVSVKSL